MPSYQPRTRPPRCRSEGPTVRRSRWQLRTATGGGLRPAIRSGGGNGRTESNENKAPRRHPHLFGVRVKAQPEGPPPTRPHGREKKTARAPRAARSPLHHSQDALLRSTVERRSPRALCVCVARCERGSRGDWPSTPGTQISVLLLDCNISPVPQLCLGSRGFCLLKRSGPVSCILEVLLESGWRKRWRCVFRELCNEVTEHPGENLEKKLI